MNELPTGSETSEDNDPSGLILKAFAVFAVVFVGSLLVFLFTSSDGLLEDKPRSWADVGGEFVLQSSDGPVALSDYRGKVVVMYFGFLNCPEICPNSMSIISRTLNQMANADQVQGILISIDPERDSVAQLHEFTEYFHPNIIGVTGSLDEIKDVTDDYHAYFKFQRLRKDAEDYSVRHTSRYYIINQQGQVVDALRHGSTVNELKARIEQLL